MNKFYHAVWKKIKVEECLVILSAPIARAEEKPTIVNIPCGLCTMNYSPVCGYDGNEFKVFGNGCTLNQQNCLAKINASEGEEVSSKWDSSCTGWLLHLPCHLPSIHDYRFPRCWARKM